MKLSESSLLEIRNDFLSFFDKEGLPVNYYGILLTTWLNAYKFYKGKSVKKNTKIVKKVAKKTDKKPAKKPVKKK
jgi:hypothetical protein